MTEILPMLGLGALKVLILLATAATLTQLLGRRPARLRAVVWAAALGGALLMPLASMSLPKMAVPLPTVFDGARPPLPEAHRSLTPAFGASAEKLSTAQPTVLSAKPGTAPQKASFSWTSGLLILWASGATALLLHLGLGLLRVRRTHRTAVRLTDRRWHSLLESAAQRVGCRRPVQLLISSDIEVPATVGLFKSTLLIPTYGRDWPEDRRLAVLLHELVHVRRLDWAVRILARLARAVYWFIPLTWWAVRRLDLEQELACDEEVVALGTRPTAYADHLLGIARSAVLNPAPAIPGMAMARTPDLEKRIMTLLKNTSHRRVGIAVLIPVVILVAAMVSALAAVTPMGSPAQSSSPSEITAPANPEIEKIVAEMKAAEKEIEQQAERLQAKEVAIRRQIELIEPIEIDEKAIARIEEAMEPHLEKIREIEIEMEPLHLEMEKFKSELQELEMHIEDGTLEDVQRQIHEQINEHLETIHLSHEALEPQLKALELVHLEMEELHKQMEKIHLDMEPQHEAIEEMHRALEPLHEEMQRMHLEMAPFHQQMEQLGERLENAIADEVAGRLQSHLGTVTEPGAPFDEAARRIIESARVRIQHDVIAVTSPYSENREILQDLFATHRIGTEEAFDDAVTAAAEELEGLRISVK
jgi:beta-lactamase regulating signal transducer with metallopeptidase domain/soluble cytochrome b562